MWLQRLSPAAMVSFSPRQNASVASISPYPLAGECAYTNDFRERKQTVVRAGEGEVGYGEGKGDTGVRCKVGKRGRGQGGG